MVARLAIAVLTMGTITAQIVLAQELRGTVRDSASQQPIPGAVVLLLDSAGTTLARNLTNELGRFRVASFVGGQRLRVLRIGFRPRDVLIPPSESVLDVSMVAIPVLLEPVRVTAAARCPTRRDAAQAFSLLEQARAGLLAIVVAREANPAALVRLGFQRRMDGTSEHIVRQIVRAESVAQSAISFDAVRAPIDFVRRGFVADSGGFSRFLAPDADALLDEAFAQGYCFRIADPARNRPHQLGLGFSAANRVRGRVDIAGTLWVDTAARALVDLEYRYAGLDRLLETSDPGGRLSFRTMPNGLVLIDRWVIRMVGVEPDTTRDAALEVYRVRDRPFISEAGGELAHATWPDGHAWHASLGRLQLHAVTDSGTPATGTVVRLLDTHYRVVTDSAGNLEIADLVPGPYSLMVLDPRLSDLNLELATDVRFVAARDSTVSRDFRVPTAIDTTMTRCLADARIGPTLVLGRVLTADGKPVDGVRITLKETLPPSAPRAEAVLDRYTTGTDGLFQFCASPQQREPILRIEASHDEWSAVRVFRSTERLTIVRLVFQP